MNDWKTIDTAPKDRWILLFSPDVYFQRTKGTNLGCWNDDRSAKKPKPYWDYRGSPISVSRSRPPTHWMDIPDRGPPVDVPEIAPGHTDLMVTPESLDAFMEKNPLPSEPWRFTKEAALRAAIDITQAVFAGKSHFDIARYLELGRNQFGNVEPVFDLLAHLANQMSWSYRTFGPGPRTVGCVEHIRKELREIESAPQDLEEWIDVVILAFDGAWRTGASPLQIIEKLIAKQAKNEARQWPDWRLSSQDKPIEHINTEGKQDGV